jgi:hypothetical protein
MAHAGTTSTSSGQIGLWKALLAAVVIAAIGIALVIAVPLLAGAKTTTAPAVDNAYTQIEAQRGATNLSAVSADTLAKAAAAKARAMSGVAPDNSLDAAVRAGSAGTVDNSYNDIESLRAQRGVPSDFSVAPIDPSTFDRTPRGAHGQLP